jgi:hypothetical protein
MWVCGSGESQLLWVLSRSGFQNKGARPHRCAIGLILACYDIGMGCCGSSEKVAPESDLPPPEWGKPVTVKMKKKGMFSSDYNVYTEGTEEPWMLVDAVGSMWDSGYSYYLKHRSAGQVDDEGKPASSVLGAVNIQGDWDAFSFRISGADRDVDVGLFYDSWDGDVDWGMSSEKKLWAVWTFSKRALIFKDHDQKDQSTLHTAASDASALRHVPFIASCKPAATCSFALLLCCTHPLAAHTRVSVDCHDRPALSLTRHPDQSPLCSLSPSPSLSHSVGWLDITGSGTWFEEEETRIVYDTDDDGHQIQRHESFRTTDCKTHGFRYKFNGARCQHSTTHNPRWITHVDADRRIRVARHCSHTGAPSLFAASPNTSRVSSLVALSWPYTQHHTHATCTCHMHHTLHC